MVEFCREQFQRHRPKSSVALTLFVLFVTLLSHNLPSQSKSSINLRRVFAPESPCRTYTRPIQFLTETTLVLLSGSTEDCYRSVLQGLTLNVVSIDGRVVARKNWPSTDPGVVIASGRLVYTTSSGLEVLDQRLAPVESLQVDNSGDGSVSHRNPFMQVTFHGQGMLSVLIGGHEYVYGGTPLKRLREIEPAQFGEIQTVFEFADGQKLVKNAETLILKKEGAPDRTVANLEWVIPPCKGKGYVNCQAYGAGSYLQVSTGKKRRVLVISNGSRLPVTDAAGLFPYFRLQVFDLDTGAEIYREEQVLRTAQRYASISPDGDLLATTDGQEVIVRNLH
jgi:hypothetical protein